MYLLQYRKLQKKNSRKITNFVLLLPGKSFLARAIARSSNGPVHGHVEFTGIFIRLASR
jgi:hypothetical protein